MIPWPCCCGCPNCDGSPNLFYDGYRFQVTISGLGDGTLDGTYILPMIGYLLGGKKTCTAQYTYFYKACYPCYMTSVSTVTVYSLWLEFGYEAELGGYFVRVSSGWQHTNQDQATVVTYGKDGVHSWLKVYGATVNDKIPCIDLDAVDIPFYAQKDEVAGCPDCDAANSTCTVTVIPPA